VPADAPLRAIFAGRRGRLLAGLLLAEFAGAVQSVAYSAVLPLAARDLNGGALYGATLAAGSLTTILVLSAGPWLLTRLDARQTVFAGTALYVAGVVLAATATAMIVVLLGAVLRGVAGGLLTGFGLTVIGGLYEDELRARVVGLFALMWVLPALVGAPLNAVIAVALGWRWAMVWPVLVVAAARVLVGRDAAIVPWEPGRRESQAHTGALVLCGLIAASLASAEHAAWAVAVFAAGLGLAAWASRRTVVSLLDRDPRRVRAASAFLVLCLAYFGGAGLVSLGVVEGLHRGPVAGSIAVGAGLLAWSLTGALRQRVDLRMPGLVLLVAALALEAGAQALPDRPGAVVAIAAWAVGGLGMGLSYPRLYAAPLDGAVPASLTAIAAAVSFAELAGTAMGSLAGGGVYSLADGLGLSPSGAIATGFAVLSCLAISSVALAARTAPRVSSAAPTAP
jgi:MFS family permease